MALLILPFQDWYVRSEPARGAGRAGGPASAGATREGTPAKAAGQPGAKTLAAPSGSGAVVPVPQPGASSPHGSKKHPEAEGPKQAALPSTPLGTDGVHQLASQLDKSLVLEPGRRGHMFWMHQRHRDGVCNISVASRLWILHRNLDVRPSTLTQPDSYVPRQLPARHPPRLSWATCSCCSAAIPVRGPRGPWWASCSHPLAENAWWACSWPIPGRDSSASSPNRPACPG